MSECGCPGSYKMSWCDDIVAKMKNTECQTSTSMCTSDCGGVWCTSKLHFNYGLNQCVFTELILLHCLHLSQVLTTVPLI